ncbi:MAG: hypothetical protein U9Q62_03020 [Campylobacterota bacterium]|nr:hypothetical protein [Campylobacterota bacterium]
MMRLLNLITALVLGSTLNAASISAKYDISFSVFGKIGEATVSFKTYGKFYHIYIDGGLSGTAASIGQNRREVHESFGVIENGILKPELYKKIRRSDHRHEDTYYVFDPDSHNVQKFRFRQKNIYKSHFNWSKMKNVETMTVEKSDSLETLPYKAENDLLSLFFNVRTLLGEIPQGSEKSETTAGAKGEKGEITITNPAGKKRKEIAKLMPDNEDRLVTVVINQDIFQSDKGELYINLDADYLAKEAMLKDVLLFGDVRGKRVWQKGEIR